MKSTTYLVKGISRSFKENHETKVKVKVIERAPSFGIPKVSKLQEGKEVEVSLPLTPFLQQVKKTESIDLPMEVKKLLNLSSTMEKPCFSFEKFKNYKPTKTTLFYYNIDNNDNEEKDQME